MDFSDEDIAEFIEILERDFGEPVSPDEARLAASRMMTLYWMMATMGDSDVIE